jgi:pseudouridine-5'-phosphate glycosidase
VVRPLSDPVVVAPDVSQALDEGRPVVALETTLVTHGLPAREGVATACAMEEAVRAEGAVPATIGVLDGRARVGLSKDEIERLAAAPGVAKLNLGNLAAQIASGAPGSTTVAATALLARRAGLFVFATGGIGGVHRDFAETGDVSADLGALARIPMAVVCSGAKAMLDLPRTLEALETLGVPVLGLATDRFPAFYQRDSGLPVDRGFERMEELAEAVRLHFALGAGTGVVVANPVPPEHEMPAELYEGALRRALVDAAREGVRGRAVTPFLLERFRVLTEGRSLFSNRGLLLSNARAAARLARALSAGLARDAASD